METMRGTEVEVFCWPADRDVVVAAAFEVVAVVVVETGDLLVVFLDWHDHHSAKIIKKQNHHNSEPIDQYN
jgi:hypothetical protein